jgi:metal-responsive CopG/Arc/MetJ family transcriptional regulator
MGREEVKEERRIRVVSMTIDEELLEQLEIYAIKHKMSRSSAVKLAIRKMLEEEGGKK